jgi:AcrR family transcriptional regulator
MFKGWKMEKTKNIKEHIMDVTTQLIQESDGDINQITIRRIAERAQVGLGLINYHFGSKDKLILECIQRIINNVVHCFTPEEKVYGENDDKYRLANWAKQVYDFLFENRVISMMSILGDMQDYRAACNSVNTQIGLALALDNFTDNKQKRMLVFTLTSIMQVAFLLGEYSKEVIGYDLYKKEERDLFIDTVVEMLFDGIVDRWK